MATLRVEFELDREVYPELYAALAALKNPASREERLRQLAAGGLTWEKVRIHGAAVVEPAAPAEKPKPVARAPRAAAPTVAADRTAAPASERRQGARDTARETARTGPNPKRRLSDFVDLALDAGPSEFAAPGSRPSAAEVEEILRELPVLRDVVSDNDAPPDLAADPYAPEHAVPSNWTAPVSRVPPPTSLSDAARQADAAEDALPLALADRPAPAPAPSAEPETAEALDDAVHVTALSSKPATRSRLMKMKERGLFKNG